MICKEWEQMVREASPESISLEAILNHLAQCPDCQSGSLFPGERLPADHRVAPSLTDRIIGQLEEEAERRRRRRSHGLAGLAGSLAALFLVILVPVNREMSTFSTSRPLNFQQLRPADSEALANYLPAGMSAGDVLTASAPVLIAAIQPDSPTGAVAVPLLRISVRASQDYLDDYLDEYLENMVPLVARATGHPPHQVRQGISQVRSLKIQ